MKHRTFQSLTVVSCFLVATGTASAGTFDTLAWQVLAGSANVEVRATAGGTLDPATFGYGSLQATYAGADVTPVYCLDVFHSFGWGSSVWEADRLVVPPDPISPPPWNTDHAAWLYNAYAGGAITANEAGALQIALWEVTHDQSWRSGFSTATWYNTCDFRFVGASVDFAARRTRAGAMLDALNGSILGGGDSWVSGYAHYYRPSDFDPDDPEEYHGQGMIGEIPEPSVLLVLGLGLATAGGLRLRRRRRT